MSIFSAKTIKNSLVAVTAPARAEVSVPLYIGGWIVLLAGNMAVAYQLASSPFTSFAVGMSTIGVATSYFLRRQGISLNWIRVGAFVLTALLLLSVLTGGGGGGSILMQVVPDVAYGTQDMLLACALTLAATFWSFLLISDDAVVFSCVFAIAQIGLTGTVSVNRELIESFIVFLAAAVFLLVHQNYLYNRPAVTRRADAATEFRLLRTQIGMGLACGAATIAIGFLIAIPIQMAGRGLSLGTVIRRLSVPVVANAPGFTSIQPGLTFNNPRRFDVGVGPVGNDPTVLLTVTGPKPYYWRGRTYDIYNGRGWDSSFADNRESIGPTNEASRRRDSANEYRLRRADLTPLQIKSKTLTYKFNQSTAPSFTVFSPGEPETVRASIPQLLLFPDRTMSFRWNFGAIAPDTYEVDARVIEPRPNELNRASTDYPINYRSQYILQQGDYNATLERLAEEATTGASTPYQKAEAIRRFVAARCEYTLDAPAVPSGRDAAEFFLNDSKLGYCDLYATAVAILCRYAGLPARVATGFIPGTPSKGSDTTYVLTGNDRHAWAEVYFPRIGWIPIDATDITSTTAAARAQTAQQNQSFLDKARRWLSSFNPVTAGLIALGVAALLFVVVNETQAALARRRGVGGVTRTPSARYAAEILSTYEATARYLGRNGVARPATMTPGAHLTATRRRFGPEVAETLAPLTALTERSLYSDFAATPLTEADASAARRSASAVRTAVKTEKKTKNARQDAQTA